MSELAGGAFRVPGANPGIGLATGRTLPERGGRVYVASRSRDKGEAAVTAIKASSGRDSVWFQPLDLADLESVRSCASAFLALREPLHVLVTNPRLGAAPSLTNQAFHLTFRIT